jgi:eukaryotic-like serine/threonine-protein kinase
LSYAHELVDNNGEALHIVHRDMSPPNVLITKYGEIKIVDFGLAKASSQLEKSEPGIIKGKFAYLSPEAATGQDVDARTDVFAVGIILWELLTGQRLFLGDTDFQTVKKVQQCVIPSASQVNPKVPKELERILNRSLAQDPAQRYQQARDLGQDLTRFLFSFSQPVSSWDVANLVAVAKKAKKPGGRAPQGSIIDKLIEEALFEFTSLKEDEEGQDPASAQKPAAASGPLGSASFVDPTNWANEIGSPSARAFDPRADANSDLRASLKHLPEEGNLSALEDASMESRPVSVGGIKSAAKPVAPNATPAKKSGGGGLVIALGLLVVLLLVGGAAAAWFLKLIPH